MKYFIPLILLLTSCTTKFYAYPSLSGTSLTKENAQQKLSELVNKQIETAKLLLTIKAQREDKVYAFRQALVFETKAPLRLSLETYPVNAAWLISKLIAYDQEFIFEDFENKEKEQGAVDDQLINRYYNLPLNHLELLNIIIGKLPEAWLKDYKWSAEVNQLSLLFVSQDKSRFILTENGKLKKVLLFKPNSQELILSVDYVDPEQALAYQEIFGQSLPKNLKLFIPEYQIETKIDVRAISLNQPIDQQIFQLTE